MPEEKHRRPTLDQLPLATLMKFASYAHAKSQNPELDRTNFAKSINETPKKLMADFKRLEAVLGTFLLERDVTVSKSREKAAYKPRYPEEQEWYLNRPGYQNCEVSMRSELTLDGQIWAAFAQHVFALFDTTVRATARIDLADDVKSVAAEVLELQIEEAAAIRDPDAPRLTWEEARAAQGRTTRRLPWAEKSPVPSAQRSHDIAEREIPSRRHPYEREVYRLWLDHKVQLLKESMSHDDLLELAHEIAGLVDPDVNRPAWSQTLPRSERRPKPNWVKSIKEQAVYLESREPEPPADDDLRHFDRSFDPLRSLGNSSLLNRPRGANVVRTPDDRDEASEDDA